MSVPTYSGGRIPADDSGGTCSRIRFADGSSCSRIIDLSNTRRIRRRELSNVEAIERVERFLRTLDRRHLPPELQGEAEGILAFVIAAGRRPLPPWPASAARPDPGRGASISETLRALTGDEHADAPSGLFES
jgi:hypothetical protein